VRKSDKIKYISKVIMAPARKEQQTKKTESARIASAKNYSENATDIQKKKLISGLIKGRRRPTPKTLAKYNLKVDDKGELIVPPEFMPKQKITVITPPPQDITVKAPIDVIEHPKQMKEGAVSSQDVYDYITTKYNDDRVKNNKKPIEVKKLGGALKNILKHLGLVKDYSQDIMPIIKNSDLVLKTIKDKAPSATSEQKYLHHVFNIAKNVPQVRDQIPESLWRNVYGKEMSDRNKGLGDTRYDNLTEKSVYQWNHVVDAVRKTFGKDSEEYLFFQFFQEVPGRDEVANIHIVRGTKKGNDNYIHISGPNMVVHINKYKTVSQYGPKTYTLSKSLVKLISDSLKKDPREKLFNMDGGINVWLRTILDEAGFPKFPYGPETTPNDRGKIVSAIRHVFATFANSDLNKGEFPKERDLANMMGHTVSQSHMSYRNKNFFTQAQIRLHKRN
jgi:2-hydroxy-3-keto-5-methylthiopentenyl-1-phosphate phosphatase